MYDRGCCTYHSLFAWFHSHRTYPRHFSTVDTACLLCWRLRLHPLQDIPRFPPPQRDRNRQSQTNPALTTLISPFHPSFLSEAKNPGGDGQGGIPSPSEGFAPKLLFFPYFWSKCIFCSKSLSNYYFLR